MSGNHVHPHEHPHQHPHHGEHQHPHTPGLLDRRTALRTGAFGLGAALLAACGSSGTVATANSTTTSAEGSNTTATGATASDTTVTSAANQQLAGFDAFADTVTTFTNGDLWMVECNGIPMHPMMIGITNWQQQVPVAQNYTGDNAWQLPITPQLADEPISAKTGLFRGAIALAVNGIPIFNALNNRGDDAFLVGELDDFGGHCGRADDYHYHAAPLHLQDAVGEGNPIAYALDGFAIYGTTEPDGSAMQELDEYNGHIGADGEYHYHGTTVYPYINGGLVGVVEAGDQVEPQPRTPAFRPAGEPLAGATITNFEDLGNNSYRLEYDVDGSIGTIEYSVDDTTVEFEFTAPSGDVTTETYTR